MTRDLSWRDEREKMTEEREEDKDSEEQLSFESKLSFDCEKPEKTCSCKKFKAQDVYSSGILNPVWNKKEGTQNHNLQEVGEKAIAKKMIETEPILKKLYSPVQNKNASQDTPSEQQARTPTEGTQNHTRQDSVVRSNTGIACTRRPDAGSNPVTAEKSLSEMIFQDRLGISVICADNVKEAVKRCEKFKGQRGGFNESSYVIPIKEFNKIMGDNLI